LNKIVLVNSIILKNILPKVQREENLEGVIAEPCANIVDVGEISR